MQTPQEAELLRIFIGEGDKYEGRPLYERILEEARAARMAGVTILRGLMGFGAHSHIHSAKILRLAEDLPIIIEIVDDPAKIRSFLPLLDPMIQEGMVTLEKVRLFAYRRTPPPTTH